MTYPQEIFTAFSFIGFVVVLIPFPWHLEAWNTGTCLFMFWTALGCLNLFINSIVWHHNVINWAPSWCDFSTRVIMSIGIAIPACSLCINRRLYHIATVKTVTKSKAEKRREVLVDLSIGLAIPILYQILYYINQGHRYNILEDLGCWPYVYNSVLSMVTISTPLLLLAVISACYAMGSIRALNKSRAQFNEMLSSHSNLNSSRYVRLICLASLEIFLTVPACIILIVYNSKLLRKWISWDNTHHGFSRVDQFPSVIWRMSRTAEITFELTRWSTVACALVFFAFFGFADEARIRYRLAIDSIGKTLGISSLSGSNTTSSGTLSSNAEFKFKSHSTGKLRPAIPVHVHADFYQHRESTLSLDVSFTDAGGLLSEKSSNFAPTLSYGAMTLNDAGGSLSDVDPTLPNYSQFPISPTPSSSNITSPPGLTPKTSSQNIEISSLRRDSEVALTPVEPEKAHTHDVV